MIRVSIIIVHHNQDEYTNSCLDSLSKITLSKRYQEQILVVDNGSQEPFKLSKKRQSKKVKVIRSESNLGFTGGNNLGIYYTIENYDSDYILFLNNDTQVHPNFLDELLKVVEKNPQVGAVSPKIYFSAGREYFNSYQKKDLGKVLWYAGGTIDWQHLVAFHRGVDEIDVGHFDNVTETDFLTGCCMLVRREVLEKYGTFDKNYFLYLEDVDLGLRIKEAGYELKFCPSSVIWHENAGSSQGAGSSLHSYYQTRNRLLFGWKHLGKVSWMTILRIGLSKLVSGNPSERVGVLHAILGRFGKQSVV